MPTETHPTPSTMARDGIPGGDDATLRSREEQSAARIAYAAGVAAERARVAAWLREEAGESSCPDTLAGLADEIEGKASS